MSHRAESLLTSRSLLLTLLLFALSWLTPRAAHAQRLFVSSQLAAGSGMTMGNGPADQTVSRRTPFFVDLGLRTWSDESPTWLWGGSVRMEMERSISIAVVPRLELLRAIGGLQVIPGIGVPFFFAPFSMLGIELGAALRMPMSDALALHGRACFDGFFFGSDVPEDSAVVMFNLMFGVDLAF